MIVDIKRSHRKTMSLIIRDGELIVRAPHFVSERQINAFVESKRAWIEKKLSEHRPMGFVLDQKFMRLFGEMMRVEVVEASTFYVSVETSIEIGRPPTMSDTRFVELVELHFKTELEKILAHRVPYFAAQLHLKTPEYKVRRYKRLYGRCTKDHRLAFNTYLFHDSLEFIDYVILHECAHILEFNHSPEFYSIITGVMPDYKSVIAANKS